MLFSSITFLYYFFPLLLICYFITPMKYRNHVLLLCSVLFYFYGEPKFLILLILLILFSFIAGKYLEQHIGNKKLLSCLLCVLFAFLFFFKYYDFAIYTINGLFQQQIPLLYVLMPIGISFYTFQMSSYLIDIYRGEVKASKSIINFSLYVMMFPQLIAGPIVRYQNIERQLTHRHYCFHSFNEGMCRFIVGLSKKVILADAFGLLCEELLIIPNIGFFGGCLFAISATLQIYFDFSGYSDMAIGLGQIFGFHLPENFKYPLAAASITEFWQRWHMTLSSWFKDYVYIPLGGNRKGIRRQVFNIAIVWFLTGLWHGAAWNFILWGVLYAILLIIEKLGLRNFLEQSRGTGHVYTLCFVFLSFVIFKIDDMDTLVELFQNMQSFAWSNEVLYYLQSYAIYLFIGIMAAMPFAKKLYDRYPKFHFMKYIVCIALLLVCTGYLLDGSFHPFLYFRF